MLSFYLYSICSISLTIGYIAVLVLINGLLRLFLGVDPGPETRKAIAGGLGFSLVALPLWWFHWRWLRRQFARVGEEGMHFHRVYLFVIICLNVVAMLLGGGIGAMSLAKLALGVSEQGTASWVGTGMALSILVISSGLWLHHWHQFDAESGAWISGLQPNRGVR